MENRDDRENVGHALNEHIRESDKTHNEIQKSIIRLEEQGKADHKESDSRYDAFKEVKKAVLWFGALVAAAVVAAVMKAVLRP